MRSAGYEIGPCLADNRSMPSGEFLRTFRLTVPLLAVFCAALWPSALLPCEQEIRPGQSLKLARNWRVRPAPNNPGLREPGFNDSNWLKTVMPFVLRDDESTRKHQGTIWFRCTIKLDEKHFVRSKPEPDEFDLDEADSATESTESTSSIDIEETSPESASEQDGASPAAPDSAPERPDAQPAPAEAAPDASPAPDADPAPDTDPVVEETSEGPPPESEDDDAPPGRGQADPAAGAERSTLEAPAGAPPAAAPGGQPAQPDAPAAPGDDRAPGPDDGFDESLDEELEFELGPPRLQGMGDLALYLGSLSDADVVYFNGQQIGQTGVPDPEKPAFDVEKERLYSIPHELWRPGENVIAVMVLATTQGSGLPNVPEIVPEQARARSLFRSHALAIVFSFLYILVAAFFFLFALFFHDQKEHLFFALFSLFLGLYNLLRTNMRYVLFDQFTFETTYQMELILLMLLPVCFVNFMIHMVRLKPSRPVLVYFGVYGLLIVTTLFVRTPVGWSALINLNLLLMLVAIGIVGNILYRHYADHRENLKYVVYGMAPMVVAVGYDMFVTFFGLPWIRITVYTFLIFLGFIARQLSGSILQLFHRMREQEEDLMGLEKRKTRSIFNISREFSVILEGIYNGLGHLENRTTPTGKKGARKSERDKKPNIDRSMRNLENLVNDSRLIQLLESNDYAERNVNFSLRKLSEEVIDRALVATGEPKKRLLLTLPEEEIQVSGDPDLLSTALYHLVENALYYSTGRIEVYAEREYSALKFTVRDEGPGMGPEQQRIIFQKFVRGSDDDEVPGIGIGLPIVDLIARQLRGELRLESGQGFFSTFIFQVPLPPDQRAA